MNPNSITKKNLYEKYTDIMPRGAGALFFIQIFATLAFSVLYSTLVLYATDGLKLSDTVSTGITASFVAFNYGLHLLGGYIGGRFFSYRLLFAIGMFTQLMGCLLLSIPTLTLFYWGLAFFLTGAGINVTCINCMLTQLFQPNDRRREAAFLWNYSGMNLGFFVGFSVSGYFQLHHGYHQLFLFAAVGNFAALLLVFLKWNVLQDMNTSILTLKGNEKLQAHIKGFTLLVILALALRWLLEHAHLSNRLILALGAFMALVIAFLAITQPSKEDGNKIWAYLILGFAALAFYTLYQIAPMGLMLFIERNVDRHYLGMLIAPQWVQNINTLIIILGGPSLSVLFTFLRERGVNLTIPLQFSFALLLIGASMAILPVGIHFANAQGYSHFNWIILSYILQSIGELFIAPIGYAMVGQLAPIRLQGLMMGTWMMIIGVGAALSGYFSNLALEGMQSTDPLVTNPGFSHIFNLLGWGTMGAGILLFLLLPFVINLSQEKKRSAHPRPISPAGL